MRVKVLMRDLAIGFSEETFDQLDEFRILMRFANDLPLILTVERVCAGKPRVSVHALAGGHIGLTAAVDTASGACHDLDEVTYHLALADRF